MMIAIELSPEIENRLDVLAKATGKTKVACARDVSAEYLDDIDDVRIAERVAERIRCGDEEVVPLEQVMKRYDLEG